MNDSYSSFLDAFEDAVDAYYKEDYKTAHKLFLPLAEQGDDEAQFNLGMMYAFGLGFHKTIRKRSSGIVLLPSRNLMKLNIV